MMKEMKSRRPTACENKGNNTNKISVIARPIRSNESDTNTPRLNCLSNHNRNISAFTFFPLLTMPTMNGDMSAKLAQAANNLPFIPVMCSNMNGTTVNRVIKYTAIAKMK